MKYKVEAFDIWQYLCKIIYEPLIRCRIDFAGHIDLDILKKAVTLSMNTIPLIGCCFNESPMRLRWAEKNFTCEDIVRVVEADTDVNEQIRHLFSSGIDFTQEPQLKINLIRGTDRDTFCAIISHIVCDGAGFKQYLYLLCELYTKLKNHETISSSTFYPRGIQPLFAGVKLREKISILRSRYDAYDSANKKEQKGVSFSESNPEPYMETRVISKENFERLKSFVKRNHATMNDILMALFAKAFCKNTDTKRIMLSATMDLRKFISPGENFGISNFSSNCMCHFTAAEHDLLTDTLKQVSEQMKLHKSGKNILKSVLLWNFLVHLLPYCLLKRYFTKIVTLPIISFTNLGILDKSLLCFDNSVVKSAYLTASIKPSPYFQIAASTYNDCCILSCNFYGSSDDKKWVDGLLDDILAEIETLV